MESDRCSRGCQPSYFDLIGPTSFAGRLDVPVLAERTSQVGRAWW